MLYFSLKGRSDKKSDCSLFLSVLLKVHRIYPSRDVQDALQARKNKDFVIEGDLSIAKEDSTEGMDSTDTAPHTVKPEESYILKAEYDVSAIANSRETFGKFFRPVGVPFRNFTPFSCRICNVKEKRKLKNTSGIAYKKKKGL